MESFKKWTRIAMANPNLCKVVNGMVLVDTGLFSQGTQRKKFIDIDYRENIWEFEERDIVRRGSSVEQVWTDGRDFWVLYDTGAGYLEYRRFNYKREKRLMGYKRKKFSWLDN